ncbi:glycosyltransferase [Parabacteroides sp. AM08-6]|uniref:glycosyltransferase n=1 Tax=Parabacteroides sp. AM08-6 TaxID=2292053 RepID=UPI000EFE52D7|nr:glycosyltransferase [Parabacteroides sp. AM08-6]RHJ84380.1 glycosyltransferase [Parabacteroides sp. AM08-6]
MAKILLVNKFYYPRGGDCTATLTLERLLRQKGHEVAIFSTEHPLNIQGEWNQYFPSEIKFTQGGLYTKIKATDRIFFSHEVKKKFNQLLETFHPDILHAHNIHSYLSPYIIKLAASKGIKTVWTLHDYKLICPVYTCLRDNSTCELCLHNKYAVLQHKCMKNSFAGSFIAFLEACVWNKNILEKYTDTFISPSHFLKGMMVKAGYNSNKIQVLHNFIESPSTTVHSFQKEDYYCYVGRLSPEKGVERLLQAAQDIPYTLKIVGDGELSGYLKQKYNHKHIHFLGQQPREKVLEIVGKARFSVVPSIWYENNPFSIIEALCVGTPVIGSRIGGIPELIESGENGDLFTPLSKEEMKEKITDSIKLYNDTYPFATIAKNAQDKFSAETFYNNLIQIYEQ